VTADTATALRVLAPGKTSTACVPSQYDTEPLQLLVLPCFAHTCTMWLLQTASEPHSVPS
jgi:hypothetical protein